MKRTTIITALLTACLVGASAQEPTTPIDNVFNQLSNVKRVRSNNGHGTFFSASSLIFTYEFCAKEMCDECTTDNTVADVESANRRERQNRDHILSVIRQGLDSLSAIPGVEESYHFESHRQGIDTIQYAICLRRGEGLPKFNKQSGYTYYEFPGSENITFTYSTRPKPCGKHFDGLGELRYSRDEETITKEYRAFSWAEYLQTVAPILNQRGITQREFRWVRDENVDKNIYIFRTELSQEDGSLLATGETSGTLYFIPRDQSDLMESVVKDFRAATQEYINKHPEQAYRYTYNNAVHPVDNPNSRPLSLMFRTMRQDDDTPRDGYVFIGSDIRGYYLLICNVTDAMGVPDEWPILKSIVKGKKTYHKGMKP